MSHKKAPSILLYLLIILSLLAGGCQPTATPEPATSIPAIPTLPSLTDTVIPKITSLPSATETQEPVVIPPTEIPTDTPTETPRLYIDAAAPVEARVADLLGRMTLEEKIGQMTQVEKGSITPEDVATYFIGSLLSGGGGSPATNNVQEWAKMVDGFQSYALQTRLQIPMIYGVDSVHGHSNLYGATIFPHNIGLGAANDPELMFRIGQATAAETSASGIWWTFSPVVAVVQDIRWGRTYESFSENPDVVTRLAVPYIQGLQSPIHSAEPPIRVLATPKHFLGDGGTTWGSSKTANYKIDQGDTRVDEATLRRLFLPPYKAAVEAGAMSIMPSYSSWNGVKMHAQKYLLTDVLKGELGFKGFIISDWQAIDQISPDYYQAVVTAINAGVDMNMVPQDYKRFILTMKAAVNNGDITLERVDDAVRRILTVKFMLGLFERPYSIPELQAQVGAEASRALARQAVAQSLVLLKNDNQALPLSKEASLVFVAGPEAKDIGAQCGGWTITWQGKNGKITPGTNILEAVQQTVSTSTRVEFNPSGKFDKVTDAAGNPAIADIGIVVVGEKPYAEGEGDSNTLGLTPIQKQTIQRMRERSKVLVLVLISGRPLIITDILAVPDAIVAAWLPGTEALGVTDSLFGDQPFTGKLSFTWPRSMAQLPFDFQALPTKSGCEAPLFPFGYGLDTASSTTLEILDCP